MKNEKIGFFSTTPLWEIHNAQLVEISHREYLRGAKQIVYHCNMALASCRANPSGSLKICKSCEWQSNWNIKSLLPKSTEQKWIGKNSLFSYKNFDLERISNHKQMSLFRIDNFPIGRAVISQLQTINRETVIPTETIKTRGLEILSNSLALYSYFKETLPNDQITKVYVFGGRYASERAFLFAAEWNGIPFNTFESGSKKNKIWLSQEGETKFSSYTLDIFEQYEKRDTKHVDREVYEVGRDFFEDWRSGTSKHINFLNPNLKIEEYQKMLSSKSSILEILRESAKPILSIFTSTNYEFSSFDDFEIFGTGATTQFSVIERISKDKSILEKYLVCVRWHPNSRTSGSDDLLRIKNCILNSRNLTHIPYDQNFNSYDLLDSSEIVVTFGSTIGIEAAACGKISILLGKSSYSRLGAVHEPRSYNGFVKLLKKDLHPKSINNALVWGWWRETFGEEMKFIKVNSNKFYFEGIRIRCRRLRSQLLLNFLKHGCKSIIQRVTQKFRSLKEKVHR